MKTRLVIVFLVSFLFVFWISGVISIFADFSDLVVDKAPTQEKIEPLVMIQQHHKITLIKSVVSIPEPEQEVAETKQKSDDKSIEDEWRLKDIIWLDTSTKVIERLALTKRYISKVDRLNLQTGIGYKEQGRDYVTVKDGIYTVNGYADVTKDEKNVREPGAHYHYMFSRKARFDKHYKIIEVEPLNIR